jgi:hypothetical protein
MNPVVRDEAQVLAFRWGNRRKASSFAAFIRLPECKNRSFGFGIRAEVAVNNSGKASAQAVPPMGANHLNKKKWWPQSVQR